MDVCFYYGNGPEKDGLHVTCLIIRKPKIGSVSPLISSKKRKDKRIFFLQQLTFHRRPFFHVLQSCSFEIKFTHCNSFSWPYLFKANQSPNRHTFFICITIADVYRNSLTFYFFSVFFFVLRIEVSGLECCKGRHKPQYEFAPMDIGGSYFLS